MLFSTTLPEFRTNRLVLRQIYEDDIPALFVIFSEPQVMSYWSSAPLNELSEARALYESICEGRKSRTLFQFGIERADVPGIIGTVTVYNVDMDNARAEIGYALGLPWWKQGYMHEALYGMLYQCFYVLGLNRIEADVDPNNESSIKSLERLGFQREGFLRQRWRVNGGVQDAYFYGLLKEDFVVGE